MNRIYTGYISDPLIGQPFTGPSLKFLQDGIGEIFKGIVEAMIGVDFDPSRAYVLSLLEPYGTHQYQGGYVYFNEEIFLCYGKSSTTPFTHVPVLKITVTNDPVADPITFTDNISRNVNNIRNMEIYDQVSGTGDVDLSNCIYIQHQNWTPYTPAFQAFDASDTLVPGGVTVTSPAAYYKKVGTTMYIYVRSISFSTTTGVRYVELDVPTTSPDWIPVGTVAFGTSAVKLYGGTGTGIPAFANIELDGSGRGDGLAIRPMSNSDFGAISGFNMSFMITISLIS